MIWGDRHVGAIFDNLANLRCLFLQINDLWLILNKISSVSCEKRSSISFFCIIDEFLKSLDVASNDITMGSFFSEDFSNICITEGFSWKLFHLLLGVNDASTGNGL